MSYINTPSKTWFGNVLSSLGLSASKTIESLAPNSTAFSSAVKNSISSTMSTSRSSLTNSGNIGKLISESKYYKYAKDAVKNGLDDIKSGKLNNSDRASDAFFNSDDFSFDDSDVNVFVNNDTSDASINFTAVAEATYTSAQSVMDTMVSVASNSVAIQQRSYGDILLKLNSIDTGIQRLVKFNEDSMSKFVQSASAYYNRYNQESSSSNRNKNDTVTSLDVFSNGFNASSYKKYVKQNFNNSMIGSMLGLFGGKDGLGDFAIKSIVANPMGFVMDSMLPKLLPKVLKSTIESVDKTFADFMPAALSKLADAAWNTNPVVSILGEMLGVKEKRLNKIGAKKVTSDPAAFDGITRNAIVEVIPTYLRKILSAVTASPEISYNTRSGKYDTLDNIKSEVYSDIRNSIIGEFNSSRGGSDIRKAGNGLRNRDYKAYNSLVDALSISLEKDTKFGASNKIKNSDDLIAYLGGASGDYGNLIKDNKDVVKYLSKVFSSLSSQGKISIESARQRASGNRNRTIQQISDDPAAYGLNPAWFGAESIDSGLSSSERRKHGVQIASSAIRGGTVGGIGVLNDIRDILLRGINVRIVNGKPYGNLHSGGTSGGGNSGSTSKTSEYDLYGLSAADALETYDPATAQSKKWKAGFERSIYNGGEKIKSIMADVLFGNGVETKDAIQNLFRNGFEKSLALINDKIKPMLFGSDNNPGIFSSITGGFRDAGNAFMNIITGAGYTRSDGTAVGTNEKSLMFKAQKFFTTIKDSTKDYLFGSKDTDGGRQGGLFSSIKDTLKAGVTGWKEAIFGTDEERKGQKENVGKKLKSMIPSGIFGVLGAKALTMFAGQSVLGAVAGGPIGAMVGLTLGIGSQSTKFKDWLFGMEDPNGNRMGGFISKKTQDFVKNNKGTIIGGATVGLAKSIIFPGAGILNSIVGGPIAGALLGVAGGVIKSSDMFQDWMYGPVTGPNGERAGGFKAKVKKFFGGDGSGKHGGFGGGRKLGMAALGSVGAIIASGGILGLSVSPIIAALSGAAAGITASSDRFRDTVFGKIGEDGKRHGGSVQGLSNFFQIEFLQPMKLTLMKTFARFEYSVAKDILAPIQKLVAPIKTTIDNITTKIGEVVHGVFDKIGGAINKSIIEPISKIVVTPFKRITSLLFKGLSAIAATPLKLVGAALNGVGFVLNAGNKRTERMTQFKDSWKNFREESKNRTFKENVGALGSSLLTTAKTRIPILNRFFGSPETDAQIRDDKKDARSFVDRQKERYNDRLAEISEKYGLVREASKDAKRNGYANSTASFLASEQRKIQMAQIAEMSAMNATTQKIASDVGDLADKGTHPGSIYTHDIHLEKILNNIASGASHAGHSGSAPTMNIPELPSGISFGSISLGTKYDAAVNSGSGYASVANSSKAHRAANDAKKQVEAVNEREDENHGFLSKIAEMTKRSFASFEGIFGKKGLITAGLIALSPLIIKVLTGLLNGSLFTGIASSVGSWFAGTADNLGFDIASEGGVSGVLGNAVDTGKQLAGYAINPFSTLTNSAQNSLGQSYQKAGGRATYRLTSNVVAGTLNGIETSLDAYKSAGEVARVSSTAGATLTTMSKGKLSGPWNAIKKLLNSAITKLSETFGKLIGKAAGGSNPVSKLLGKVVLKLDDIIAKGGNKLLKWLGIQTGKTAGSAATLGLAEVVFAAIGGIDGHMMAARIFKVNAEDTDYIMRNIATAVYALLGTSVGGWIDIAASVGESIFGYNFVYELCELAYDLIASSDAKTSLSTSQDTFKQEYLDSQYKTYAASAKSDGETVVSKSDFEANLSTYAANDKYKLQSFADYNYSQNKGLFDTIGSYFSGKGSDISTYFTNMGNNIKNRPESAVAYAAKIAFDAAGNGARSIGEIVKGTTGTVGNIGKDILYGLDDATGGTKVLSTLGEVLSGSVNILGGTVYAVGDALGNVATTVGEGAINVTNRISDLVQGKSTIEQAMIDYNSWWDNKFTDIGTWFTETGKDLSGLGQTMVDNIKTLWSSVADSTVTAVANINGITSSTLSDVDKISEVSSSLYSGNNPNLSGLSSYSWTGSKILIDPSSMARLNTAASGGVVTGNRPILSMLSPGEIVYNPASASTQRQQSSLEKRYARRLGGRVAINANTSDGLIPFGNTSDVSTIKSILGSLYGRLFGARTKGWGADEFDSQPNTKLINVVDRFDYLVDTLAPTKGSTVSSGKGRYGRGAVQYNQEDPRWNRDKSLDIYDSGCGPTAAAIAASAYGSSLNPVSAAKIINRSGYREPDGGTRPDGIALAGTMSGIPMHSGIPSATAISSNLKSGKPVVLMGQNTRGSSAYGSGMHYIVGTGMDSRGNVNVIDPLKNGSRSYKFGDVVRGAKSAVYTGTGKRTSGLFSKNGRGDLFLASSPKTQFSAYPFADGDTISKFMVDGQESNILSLPNPLGIYDYSSLYNSYYNPYSSKLNSAIRRTGYEKINRENSISSLGIQHPIFTASQVGNDQSRRSLGTKIKSLFNRVMTNPNVYALRHAASFLSKSGALPYYNWSNGFEADPLNPYAPSKAHSIVTDSILSWANSAGSPTGNSFSAVNLDGYQGATKVNTTSASMLQSAIALGMLYGVDPGKINPYDYDIGSKTTDQRATADDGSFRFKQAANDILRINPKWMSDSADRSSMISKLQALSVFARQYGVPESMVYPVDKSASAISNVVGKYGIANTSDLQYLPLFSAMFGSPFTGSLSYSKSKQSGANVVDNDTLDRLLYINSIAGNSDGDKSVYSSITPSYGKLLLNSALGLYGNTGAMTADKIGTLGTSGNNIFNNAELTAEGVNGKSFGASSIAGSFLYNDNMKYSPSRMLIPLMAEQIFNSVSSESQSANIANQNETAMASGVYYINDAICKIMIKVCKKNLNRSSLKAESAGKMLSSNESLSSGFRDFVQTAIIAAGYDDAESLLYANKAVNTCYAGYVSTSTQSATYTDFRRWMWELYMYSFSGSTIVTNYKRSYKGTYTVTATIEQIAVIKAMLAMRDKLKYTTGDNRLKIDSGFADSAAVVAYSYIKSGTAVSHSNWSYISNLGKTPSNMSNMFNDYTFTTTNMQPGDIIVYTNPASGEAVYGGVYFTDGLMLGHPGGKDGTVKGPSVYDTYYSYGNMVCSAVKRVYNTDGSGELHTAVFDLNADKMTIDGSSSESLSGGEILTKLLGYFGEVANRLFTGIVTGNWDSDFSSYLSGNTSVGTSSSISDSYAAKTSSNGLYYAKYNPNTSFKSGLINLPSPDMSNGLLNTMGQRINYIKDAAVADWGYHHVLPSVTVGQAIAESSIGTQGEPAVNANNLFGIMSGDVSDQSRIFTDTSGKRWLKYSNWGDSIFSHGANLNLNAPTTVGNLDRADVLNQLGYYNPGNPSYGKDIGAYITQYNSSTGGLLDELDKVVTEQSKIDGTSSVLSDTESNPIMGNSTGYSRDIYFGRGKKKSKRYGRGGSIDDAMAVYSNTGSNLMNYLLTGNKSSGATSTSSSLTSSSEYGSVGDSTAYSGSNTSDGWFIPSLNANKSANFKQINTNYWNPYHKGIDYAAASGTNIKSPIDGIVNKVGYDADGFGNYITIKDNKYGAYHYFAHQNRIGVHEGESVSRGKIVGQVGSTGLSTGPHLHYQIMSSDGELYNPNEFPYTATGSASRARTSSAVNINRALSTDAEKSASNSVLKYINEANTKKLKLMRDMNNRGIGGDSPYDALSQANAAETAKSVIAMQSLLTRAVAILDDIADNTLSSANKLDTMGTTKRDTIVVPQSAQKSGTQSASKSARSESGTQQNTTNRLLSKAIASAL